MWGPATPPMTWLFRALAGPRWSSAAIWWRSPGTPQAGPDAIPGRWPAALDRLLALGGPDARYVPGHGSVVDAGFVRAQRDELAARFGVSL
ncbi:hypothetical protein SANTM175S_03821 [Streptomyces antimycoticus]